MIAGEQTSRTTRFTMKPGPILVGSLVALSLLLHGPASAETRTQIFERASSELAEKKYEHALRDCNKLIEMDGRRTDVLLLRARILMHLKQYAVARKDLSDCIAINPNEYDFFFERGRVLVELGHWDDSIKDFEAAARILPRAPDPYTCLARVYVHFNNQEKALTAANKAAMRSREHRGERANCLITFGKYTEAIEDLNFLIAHAHEMGMNSRQLAVYLEWRGTCFIRLCRYQEALQDLSRSILLYKQGIQPILHAEVSG
ncbi:MAG: tetratricopeptide repeat protein [Cyanobacteria bacterium]|nr:tetratricopeptide repeat protein [Cyanobacteriota bacterium]